MGAGGGGADGRHLGRAVRARGAGGSSSSTARACWASKIARVLGGGRCNVTHHAVDESRLSTAPRPPPSARSCAVSTRRATIAFFRELGVEMKREETGKLFPVTDRARTVLDVLVAGGARRRGGAAPSLAACLVGGARDRGGFRLVRRMRVARRSALRAWCSPLRRPQPAQDGLGRRWRCARAIARPHPDPAPLSRPRPPLTVRRRTLHPRAQRTERPRHPGGCAPLPDASCAVCYRIASPTHFGLSGPAALDVSRHYLEAKLDEARAVRLIVRWYPGRDRGEPDSGAARSGRLPPSVGPSAERLPERLARALCVARRSGSSHDRPSPLAPVLRRAVVRSGGGDARSRDR